ncbi:acyltransferase [Cellulomonas sp. PhB143]|uniref:acyltransferase family protein n=1 Tax=Cellulomonas sp. PhB143 TaxID=2485186 RepID=UPI000F92F898|nr:acyltransferase [Cellulomonas sp. PhB143]ROS78562.1 peptidoglycan/LPS O-acetylase OafA/YrhL [Cellulomonas sp. PhB143]
MTVNPPPPRARLRALDGLRFLAAVAVVGYHYTGVRTGFWGTAPSNVFPTLNHVTRYGFIGVELFFVISGFVILMTAWRAPIERFTASRIARLFPAYWAAVILTAIMQYFWGGGRQPSLRETLVNLTMLQDPFDIVDIQGAFWTLWIELKFYLLIGVFVLVGINRARVIAFAALWPLLSQIAQVTHAPMLGSLLIPSYAPYFAAGMALFLLYRDGNSVIVWLVLALDTILCLDQITDYAPRVSRYVGQEVSPAVCGVLVLVFIALVWAVSSGPLARIQWRWLTVAGALTYPLYLVHGQFGFMIIDLLHERLNAYVTLSVAVLVAVALAFALHYLVERRFHDPLRGAVQRGLSDLKT